VNFRRGLTRLGIGLWVLWLVFWTFAYAIRTPVSENAVSPPPLFAVTLVVIAVAILVLPWIASGFRPN
jgi:hypothetical protein